ncbi:hypothetical protein JCM10213v2_001449 [Rhodosporidiobolus nylandii]
MPPTQALTRVLLFPLHLSVLLTLHTAFAGCRLARLVAHLLPSLRRPRRPTPAGDLAAGRWSKVPKHLAVRLAPGGWWWSRASDEDEVVRERVEQVRLLAGWCDELEIETLSVYDETADVAAALGLTAEEGGAKGDMEGLVRLRRPAAGGSEEDLQSCPPRSAAASEDGTSGSSATLVDPSPPTSPSPAGGLTINLLSRAAGRPSLARIAQSIALGRIGLRKDGKAEGKVEELSSEAISAVCDALPFTEPDLLFVFGGPYLRLQGFPPWQVRLTEMHHYSSPSWLPSPRLTYEHLRPALDVYGRAEMRLGR